MHTVTPQGDKRTDNVSVSTTDLEGVALSYKSDSLHDILKKGRMGKPYMIFSSDITMSWLIALSLLL
jgi:hypothetical protein